jgi:hypothetical protein
MTETHVFTVEMPSSLWEAFQTLANRDGVSIHLAATRLAMGLTGLLDTDLCSLPEPPRESITRRLILNLGKKGLELLQQLSDQSQLSRSSVFRRVLYSLLITRRLELVKCSITSHLHTQITHSKCEFDPGRKSCCLLADRKR